MSNPENVRQPLDHLPPAEERDPAIDIEEPHYPGSETPHGGSHVSPDTAAEPDRPDRHGADKMPPGAR